jgi:hypothetical protein
VYVGWSAFDRRAVKNNGNVETIRAVEMNGARVHVELALTSDQQQLGLSGRGSLGADQGMLFIFPSAQLRSFWMKQMSFPIDIVWISQRRVIDLTRNAPVPESGKPLPLYRPDAPVDTVLEVPAGFSMTHNIRPGTEIRYFCATKPGIDETLIAC